MFKLLFRLWRRLFYGNRIGVVRYYKYPDRWGSPIERVTLLEEISDGVWVCDNGGLAMFPLIPEYMLFKTARKADLWAKKRLPSDSDGIFKEINNLRRGI